MTVTKEQLLKDIDYILDSNKEYLKKIAKDRGWNYSKGDDITMEEVRILVSILQTKYLYGFR